MNTELLEASADDIPVLRRLMQLYLYDLRSLDGWDIGDDGAYGNTARIERFWTDEQRERHLVKADGKLAGFVLTRAGTHFSGDGAQEVSEFFILSKYRLQGVGLMVATRIFDRFDGTWEVAVMKSNTPAQAFGGLSLPATQVTATNSFLLITATRNSWSSGLKARIGGKTINDTELSPVA